MASAHSESQSLLHDYDFDAADAQKKNVSTVSLRAVEDGEESSDETEALNKRRSFGFWQRLRMSIRRRNIQERRRNCDVNVDGDEDDTVRRRSWRTRICWLIPLIVLSIYAISATISDDTHHASPAGTHVPLAITQNVTPIPCHSHNDYWRRVPLYDALRHGCTGVEADVWLFPSSSDLFVGHSTRALSPRNTFRSMYIEPLVTLLSHANPSTSRKAGVFEKAPNQTLVLLVDFKNDGAALWPVVVQQLEPLRQKGYLSYWNGNTNTTVYGPITVVGTGNAPFNLITANETYRDVFFDAPLASLSSSEKQANGGGQGTVGTTPESIYDTGNSYYASVNFGKAVGWVFWKFSDKQLEAMREQIRGAHERGLKARYWGAPTWPGWRRKMVWDVLVREGVDYLNGDDLDGMQRVLLG